MPKKAKKHVATRMDIDLLKIDIQILDKKIDEVDNKLDKKFDRVITQLDGIAKGLDDMRDENTAGTDLIEKLEAKVDNHEKRIARVESSQAA